MPFFPDLAPLVTQGAFYALVRQSLLSDVLDERLGTYSWQVDMAGPSLSFVSDERPEARLDCSAAMVASVAPGPRSLLWGWAHPQPSGDLGDRLKAYGEEHGVATLTQPEVPLPTDRTGEALGEDVAQITHEVGRAVVGALGRAPYYSAPAGGGTRVLFLLESPDLPAPKVDETLPRRLMEAASSGATSDHRMSFHWLAVYSGWQLSWDETWANAEITDPSTGTKATVSFSPESLLTGIQLHLEA